MTKYIKPIKIILFFCGLFLFLTFFILLIRDFMIPKDSSICPYNYTNVWLDSKTGFLERVQNVNGQELHAVWYGNFSDWLTINTNSSLKLCFEVDNITGYCDAKTLYNNIIIPCSPCVNITKTGEIIPLNETECQEKGGIEN